MPTGLRSAYTPSMVPTVVRLFRHVLVALIEFLSPRARLAAENLLLRQQLVILQRTARRPRFKPWERRLLSSLAIRWTALQDAISIVKPATCSAGTERPGAGGGGEPRNGRPGGRRLHRSCAG